MGNLLLDKGTVYLTWAGTVWEAALVARRDWPAVAPGQFVFILDTGEGLDYGSRTLWGGYAIGNELTERGRGRLTFRPTPGRAGDDELFTFQGESIRRLFVPLRKVGDVAALDLPVRPWPANRKEGRTVGKAAPAGRALLATRPGLAVFLDMLPSLALSDTGRRTVARRFALTDAELAAVLTAHGQQAHGL